MSLMVPLWMNAVKQNNYDIDATAGGLWTNDQTYQATVPDGKRWIVLGGIINRDVSSTLTVRAYDGTNIIHQYCSQGAATSVTTWPSNVNDVNTRNGAAFPFILDEGEFIRIYFGTAQTGGAYCTCVVLEIGRADV